METAIGAISHIPLKTDGDVLAHAEILARFACEQKLAPADYAAPAVHARVVALDGWCNVHDPFGCTDRAAVMTAAGRAPLVETDSGVGLEPVAFAELVAFITELPF